jgi:hypothetical protein
MWVKIACVHTKFQMSLNFIPPDNGEKPNARKSMNDDETRATRRIEDKVDGVSGQIGDMSRELVRMKVIVEERLSQHSDRMGRLDDSVKEAAAAAKSAKEKAEAVDQTVRTWVNRGIGLWVTVTVLFAIANSKFFIELMHKA